MKYLFSIIAVLMLILAPASFAFPVFNFPNISVDFPKAMELMKSKEWAGAHKKLNTVIEKLGERGEVLFGIDGFGELYYRKGYCELNMAKSFEDEEKKKEYFQMAADSMGKCFEINMRGGKVHSKSLLYKGQAEQGLGNSANAIELYKLFKSLQPKE